MADQTQIEQVLGEIGMNVTLVTTAHQGKPNGCALMWLTQVSFAPPLVGIAVRNGSYTEELISASGCFAVNFLGEGSLELARYFGTVSGRQENKFAEVEYTTRTSGAPVLDEAVAYLDCRVISRMQTGDHSFFVGEIVEAELLRDEKILRYDKDLFFG